jgi:hypothetical protein
MVYLLIHKVGLPEAEVGQKSKDEARCWPRRGGEPLDRAGTEAEECRAVPSRDDETRADVADVTEARQLRRLLVTISDRELEPSVAIDTFRRLHDAGQPGQADSALLLCMDWRWRLTSARVLAGILATGILDEDQQDGLAQQLLWHDKVDYVHPLGWFGDTFIEVDLTSAPGAPRRREVHADPNTQVISKRRLWPPLRSWAAGRVLARNQAAATDVLARARELPARDGAAVMAGAVHVADELRPE